MAKAQKDNTDKETAEAALITETAPLVAAEEVSDDDKTTAADDAAEQEGVTITEKRAGKPTAKAGKRSAKALEVVAEKEAKEARKADSTGEEDAKPVQPSKPTRSRLERRGKQFRKHAEQIEPGKVYTLMQAADLAKKTSHVKFDASVELHVRLGVDPRHADQNIRDNVVLPAGTGKTVRIAVLADVDDAAAAKQAGADVAGIDEVLKDLDKGIMNFDILIATPSQMAKLGKYARALGPRGLMPNPKSGTVTTDVAKAVTEAKAGRVEYRVDSTGIVHLGVGKVSFSPQQIHDNIQAILTSIKTNKPNSVKGNYIKGIHVTTSMGPSIIVDVAAAN